MKRERQSCSEHRKAAAARGRAAQGRLALLLVVMAVMLVAGNGGLGQTESDQYFDESEPAQVLLERIGARFEARDCEAAVVLIRQLIEIGPEAVLPSTGQGVRLALRRLIHGQPTEVRGLYEEAVAVESQEALAAARKLATPEAYAAVVAGFPGSAAARQALAARWAMAFEAGRFRETIEQAEAYLADPLITSPQRRRALFVSAVAAVYASDRVDAGKAVARLNELGREPLSIGGSTVDPVATAESLLAGMSDGPILWPDVGGAARRSRPAPQKLALTGPFTFNKDAGDQSLLVVSEPVPTRKALLERKTVPESAPVEQVVLVSPKAFLAVRGTSLVAQDRLSGEELWRLPLVPEQVPVSLLAWPSSGQGYVATMTWSMPTRGTPSQRIPNIRGGDVPMQSLGRRLVVVREDTGQEAWSWDGRLVEPAKDLWSQGGEAEHDGPLGAQLPKPRIVVRLAGAVDGEGDERSGERTQLLEPVGSPLIYGGRVFVGAARMPRQGILVDCFLLCFDLPTGKLIWQRFIGGGTLVSYNGGGISLDRLIPAADGRRVYVESPGGLLTAVELATGDVAWVKTVPRPRRSNPWAAATGNWSGGIADAPMVVEDHLLLSDIVGPGMLCLDTDTGQTLWVNQTTNAAMRLGVAGGLVFVSGGSALVGHDIKTGERTVTVSLPGTVSGRGFVAEDAVYIPTEKGLVRVDWRAKTATIFYAYDGRERPALSLAPLADGLVSSHDDRALVFGPTDKFFREVARGAEAHPDDPAWLRRLAELHRQRDDYTQAESLLQKAVTLAARLADGERSREEQLLAYQRLTRLYQQWAEHHGREGRRAEAAVMFEKALKYATAPAAKVSTWMTLAEYYEQAGELGQAITSYAQVARHEVAQRMLVPTRTAGLELSVASKAEAALARLQRVAAGADLTLGVRREDIARLEAKPLGMLTWCMPSYTVSQPEDVLSPVVWARSDGMVVFGPQGEIRWRFARPSKTGDKASSVVAGDDIVFEKQDDVLTAHRLRDGEILWQWRPEPGHELADLDASLGVVRGRPVRRVRVVNDSVRVSTEIQDPMDQRYVDFLTVENIVVVATTSQSQTALVVRGLDKVSGKELWESAFPRNYHFFGMRQDGRRLVVLGQTPQGDLLVRRLDIAAGEELWQYSGEGTRRKVPRCIFEGGVFMFVSEAGRGYAVDGESGKLLWETPSGYRLWPGITPVAVLNDRIILADDTTVLALSRDMGEKLWDIKADGLDPTRTGIGRGTCVMADGLLVTSLGQAVAAIDPADGTTVWRHDFPPSGEGDYGLVVAGDVVTVYSRQAPEARLLFLELAGGRKLGELELGSNSGVLLVTAVRGGLFAQCGNEILVLVPGGESPPPVDAQLPDGV